MGTWYGESYRLDDVRVLAGASFSGRDWYDHWDARTHTLTAGDEVVAGAYADPVDWSAFTVYAEPVTVRWVVEVASGSGTIAIASGLDPSWSLDPAAASQDVGTLTATGPGALISQPVTVTHAELAAQAAEVVARIRGISGSLEVTQVKLRVWPTAGVAGAWVPAGESTVESTSVQRRGFLRAPGTEVTDRFSSSVDNYLDYPDPEGAQQAVMAAQPGAIAQLAGAEGGAGDFVYSGPGVGPVAQAAASGASNLVVEVAGTHFWYTAAANVNARPGWVWADMRGATPDVPTIGADPNEHQYETEAYVRPAGGGPLVPTFGGWTTGAVEVSYGRIYSLGSPGASSTWPVGPAVVHQVTVDETPDTTAPFVRVTGGATATIPAGASGVDEQVVQTIPLAGGERLLIGVDVPGIYSPAASADGLEDDTWEGQPVHKYEYDSAAEVDLIATGYLVRFGLVEVYDPAAVPKPTREPRFFVVYEGEDRPVGFGKPEDERHVFGVQTALGNYRDLTFAEYETAGDPLPDFTP